MRNDDVGHFSLSLSLSHPSVLVDCRVKGSGEGKCDRVAELSESL